MAGPINDAELLQQTDHRIADGPGVDVPAFDMDAFLAQQDLGSVGEPIGAAGVADPGEAYRRAVMEEAGLVSPNLMGNAASAIGQTAAQAGQQVQAAPGQAPMAPGQSQRQGYGASVERQGYNSAAAERIAQGPAAKGLAAQRKAIDKQFVDTVNRGAAEIDNSVNNQIYGAQQALEANAQALETRAGDVTAAQQSARDAVKQTFGVDIPEGLTGQAFAAAVNQAQTAYTQTAIQSMEADLGKARANMEAQLQVVKSMRVDPHRLARKGEFQWANAIAGIAAVSGKPGNVALANQLTNTFKEAATRDVEAQINNILNQQHVSDGFMQVWNAVARDSSTIFEAKQKMMAGVAATVGSYLEGEAMKAQSEVERARIFSIAAEVEKWGVEAKQKWETEANQIRTQRLGQELQHAASMAQVAVQRDRLAFDREQAQAQARAQAEQQRQAKAEQAVGSAVIVPGLGYMGQVMGETPAARMAIKQDIDGKTAAYVAVAKEIEDIKALVRKAGVAEGTMAALGIQNEIAARLNVLANSATFKVLDGAGLAPVSNEDLERVAGMVGKPNFQQSLYNWFEDPNGSLSSSAQLERVFAEGLKAEYGTRLGPGTPEEQAAVASRYGENILYSGGKARDHSAQAGVAYPQWAQGMPIAYIDAVPGNMAPGTQRDWANANLEPGPGYAAANNEVLNPSPKTAGQQAQARATSDYNMKAGWKDASEVPDRWLEYTETSGGAKYGGKAARNPDTITRAQEYARSYGVEMKDPVYVPGFAQDAIELAILAAEGDDSAQAALTDLATSAEWRKGGAHKLELSQFAEYALDNLSKFKRTTSGRTK